MSDMKSLKLCCWKSERVLGDRASNRAFESKTLASGAVFGLRLLPVADALETSGGNKVSVS